MIVKRTYGGYFTNVEIFIKRGESYFAKYVKKPHEKGYFRTVNNYT